MEPARSVKPIFLNRYDRLVGSPAGQGCQSRLVAISFTSWKNTGAYLFFTLKTCAKTLIFNAFVKIDVKFAPHTVFSLILQDIVSSSLSQKFHIRAKYIDKVFVCMEQKIVSQKFDLQKIA